MEENKRSYIIYYSSINAINISVCTILFLLLNWPLLAKIPLTISLFIELLYVSKLFFQKYILGHQELIHQIIFKIKSSVYNISDVEV